MVGILSVVIIGVLLAVSVFLISNTINVAAAFRKSENEIMRYIGATNYMIRAPFVVEGMVIGLLGAIIPLSFMSYIYQQYRICGGEIPDPVRNLPVPSTAPDFSIYGGSSDASGAWNWIFCKFLYHSQAFEGIKLSFIFHERLFNWKVFTDTHRTKPGGTKKQLWKQEKRIIRPASGTLSLSQWEMGLRPCPSSGWITSGFGGR